MRQAEDNQLVIHATGTDYLNAREVACRTAQALGLSHPDWTGDTGGLPNQFETEEGVWNLCSGITMRELGHQFYEIGFEKDEDRLKFRNSMVDLVRFLNGPFVFGAEDGEKEKAKETQES